MSKGQYFKDKQEAISFYRAKEDNLKDKPEWMIECLLDFATQYPNYKEYCEVEAKVKEGKKLTVKQNKKYGHLKWDKKETTYKHGEILMQNIDLNPEGTFEDIVHDKEVREKYNKYNLEFPETLPPSDTMKFEIKTAEGECFHATAPMATVKEECDKGDMKPETWEIEKQSEAI